MERDTASLRLLSIELYKIAQIVIMKMLEKIVWWNDSQTVQSFTN